MKRHLPIILILLLAFGLRFYRCGDYPPLLWDEAAIGYNAYSILQTGRDEHGQFFPLIFKSFGDYKPGFYIYLTAPFIFLFGLTELSVRLPSIIAGSLVSLLLYLLISPKNRRLSLLAAALAAITPFSLHFSRGAWETNLLTFELLLAALLFFRQKFLLSALVFGCSLYTYQAGKMVSLFLILILFIIHFPQIKLRQFFINFCLPLAILCLPLLLGLIFGRDANRLQVVSLFSYPPSASETQAQITESSPLDYALFHSRPWFFLRQVATRYFNHFSSRFLFFDGDWQSARHSAPYQGMLLLPAILFLLPGIFLSSYRQPLFRFFLFWLLIAPLPAVFTRDLIQPVRAHSLSIPLVFFLASGLNIFFDKIPKLLLIAIFSLSFLYYSDLYYRHFLLRPGNDSLYGYRQAINYLIKNQSRFSEIYFSNFYQQPYIFYLFYSRFPPALYQQVGRLITTDLDIGQVEKIGKITFSPVPYEAIKKKEHVLAIFTNEDIDRQLIDRQSSEFKNNFIPLSPINGYSTFYAYQN